MIDIISPRIQHYPQPTQHNPYVLQNIASDIKNTLSAAIGDLRLDIQAVAVRLQRVEDTTSRQENAIAQVQQVSDHHSFQLREMNRHLEDLDKRGHRHNILYILYIYLHILSDSQNHDIILHHYAHYHNHVSKT